ncbi:hypothetical protein [Alistipes sp.]|uniref:hypothetical protein n=1 Tax=Alistipes sp. TaxID=1872444 RepID=UPI0011CBC287
MFDEQRYGFFGISAIFVEHTDKRESAGLFPNRGKSSRPERCKHLAEVGCSAWWFPAYVGVFLLVGMIGFSLHIGWIEDALFSFGYPYFGTVFFRCRGAAVRVEHGREPDGENRLDGLRNTGSDPAAVVR